MNTEFIINMLLPYFYFAFLLFCVVLVYSMGNFFMEVNRLRLCTCVAALCWGKQTNTGIVIGITNAFD